MCEMTDALWIARLWTRLPLAIYLSPVRDAHDENEILVREQLVYDSITAYAQTAKSAQVASEWIAGQWVYSETVYSGGDLSPPSRRKAFQVFPCATLYLNRVVHSSLGSSPASDPKGRPTVPALC